MKVLLVRILVAVNIWATDMSLLILVRILVHLRLSIFVIMLLCVICGAHLI